MFYHADYLEPEDVEETSSSDPIDTNLPIPGVIRNPDKPIPNSIALEMARQDLPKNLDLKQTITAKVRAEGSTGKKAKSGEVGQVKGWVEKGQVNLKTVAINVPATISNDDEDIAAGSGNYGSSKK